jgi:hypothetical protein
MQSFAIILKTRILNFWNLIASPPLLAIVTQPPKGEELIVDYGGKATV